jgi:hypothetical protein
MNKPEELRMPNDVRLDVAQKIRQRRQLQRELIAIAVRYDYRIDNLHRIARRSK